MLVFAALRTTAKNLLTISAGLELLALLPLGLYQSSIAIPHIVAQIVLMLGTACAAVLAWRAYHTMPDMEPVMGRRL